MKVQTRQQTWEITYACAVLMKILCDKYGYTGYHRYNTSPYEACAYARSANLCRGHLLERGLISTNDQPVMSVIHKVSEQYAIAPVFEIKCTTGDYTHAPVNSIVDAYGNLTSLSERELLYVYLNRSQYDIFVSKKKVSRGGKEFEETHFNVYPKAQRKALIDTLCHTKINHVLNENIQLKSKIFYDLDLSSFDVDKKEALWCAKNVWEDVTRYKSDSPITVEEFERRMSVAQDAIRFYQRAYESTLRLRDRLATGKPVNIGEDAYKKVIAYFKVNAPLHVNDEDRDTKHFAMLIMENADNKRIANEWLNPQYRIKD
jgi:hypothetical protein